MTTYRKANIIRQIRNNYNLECPISMKDFEYNDKIIVLPCNHIFSEAPIKDWLIKSSNSCPVCRKVI